MLRTALLASVLAFGLAAQAWRKSSGSRRRCPPPEEVPPKNTHGSGHAEAKLDTTSKTLTYKLSWEGLTGPATMAHFHGPAAPGEDAPVIVPLGNNPTSPIKGTAQLTDDQIKEFMDGKVYANVHTTANPGGEIRGQMTRAK